MSSLQKNNIHFIRLLSMSKSKRRKILLYTASREEILALAEICLNVLQGISELSPECRRKLFRHRGDLRALAYGGVTHWKQHRERLIRQSGSGFLPVLLSAALSALSGLLS